MRVYEVTGLNAGGMPFKYRIREADVEGIEPHTASDVFYTLDTIYNFSVETGFPNVSILNLELVEEEPDRAVNTAFEKLRPFLNYNTLGQEMEIFNILEALRENEHS